MSVSAAKLSEIQLRTKTEWEPHIDQPQLTGLGGVFPLRSDDAPLNPRPLLINWG